MKLNRKPDGPDEVLLIERGTRAQRFQAALRAVAAMIRNGDWPGLEKAVGDIEALASDGNT